MFALLNRAVAGGTRLKFRAGWLLDTGRVIKGAALGLTALAVASCSTGLETGPGLAPGGQAGNAIGTGSIKIGLLLPLTATGNAGTTAKALQNAAELALSEIPSADIQLVPVDTRGTAEGAAAAASAAVASGVRMIIGPLFAAEVTAVAPIAKPAGVPVLAFSSDTNVASQGVYLLSFLPQSDINRMVGYAKQQGNRAVAAILPQTAYGTVIEAALQQAVARHNLRVVTIARYERGAAGIKQAVAQIAPIAGGAAPQVDALLIPEGAADLPTLTAELANARIDPRRVQYLGSGKWNDSSVWRLAGLNTGVFPGPDPAGWQAFVGKYKGRYGSEPPRTATLSYDAVTLAAALARIGGQQGFTDRALTDPNGFSGVDGIFRFLSNGTNQRGLAVLEVTNGTARIKEPAPTAFGAGG